MKLTKDMLETVKRTTDVCTSYGKYVILKKQMPIDDSHLEKYLKMIKDSRKDGVNIAEVLDYTLLDGGSIHSGKKYSIGIYLEEKAPGVCLNEESIWLRVNKDYDYENVANEYINNVMAYVNELEKRANASDEVYDKLVSDYVALSKHGLEVDPKPLNFFFDESNGYTIIDAIPKNANVNVKDTIYKEIWLIVFGYGLRPLMLSFTNYHFLPEDLNKRLVISGDIIAEKVKKALLKLNINEADIDKEIANNKFRYVVDNNPTEVEDLGIKIAGTLQEVAKKERAREEHNSWFFD